MPISWTADLDTGIPIIDQQHRRIVDFINHLEVAKNAGDKEAVKQIVYDCVDYTLSHFAFEESVIESAGYMFAGPHKKVHELFTRKVAEMQSRFDAGEDIATELHGMLSRWLFNHIRNEDHGYIDSVKAYLRMTGKQRDADKAELKAELLQELAAKQNGKKGWFARLFGG